MITSLRMQNFRSYKDDSFEFSEGVNIIIGPNASGKTNILEALIYTCSGRSFKATDEESIKHGAKWARLDLTTGDNKQRTIKLEPAAEKVKKTIELEGVTYSRMTISNSLPVVLFEPNHLQMLTSSPELRRTFIDNILSQIDDEFNRQKREYNRTLAQRNRLLKNGEISANKTIFAWNVRLSELAGEIVTKRMIILKQINKGLTKSYQALAKTRQKLTLEYKTNINQENYASSMLRKLEKDFSKDILRGFTGCGPHRDDIAVLIDDLPIQLYASRGETRTALLALKIQETNLLEKKTGQKPLLMLDDVFSELDGRRREALTSFLKNYQSFITTTDADTVAKGTTKSRTVISTG